MTDFRPRDPRGEPASDDARTTIAVRLTTDAGERYHLFFPLGMEVAALSGVYRWTIDSRLSFNVEQGKLFIDGIVSASEAAKKKKRLD